MTSYDPSPEAKAAIRRDKIRQAAQRASSAANAKPKSKSDRNVTGGFFGRDKKSYKPPSARTADSFVGNEYGTKGHGGTVEHGKTKPKRTSGGGTFGKPKNPKSGGNTSGMWNSKNPLKKPNAKNRAGLYASSPGAKKTGMDYWWDRDKDATTDKKKYAGLKNAAERRKFRADRGLHKGMYYGPDIFKGDMKMNERWEKAGKPNASLFAKRGNPMRAKNRSLSPDALFNRKQKAPNPQYKHGGPGN